MTTRLKNRHYVICSSTFKEEFTESSSSNAKGNKRTKTVRENIGQSSLLCNSKISKTIPQQQREERGKSSIFGTHTPRKTLWCEKNNPFKIIYKIAPHYLTPMVHFWHHDLIMKLVLFVCWLQNACQKI